MKKIGEYLDMEINPATAEERVAAFRLLRDRAESVKERGRVNRSKCQTWRRAYLGELRALDGDTGVETQERLKNLKKIGYELVEAQIENSIFMPRLSAGSREFIESCEVTGRFLSREMDRMRSERVNDELERETLVCGTGWTRIWWDNTKRGHGRCGELRVDTFRCEDVIPQPYLRRYEDMEYLFLDETLSLTRIKETWGVWTQGMGTDVGYATVCSCYYLNDEGTVGLYVWNTVSSEEIYNNSRWSEKRERYCETCGESVSLEETCPTCGSKRFGWRSVETETLRHDIYADEVDEKSGETRRVVLYGAGTEVPCYKVRQLPWVPRVNVSVSGEIYGLSDMETLLDIQDTSNKVYTKIFEKIMDSGYVGTRPWGVPVEQVGSGAWLQVKTLEQAQKFQVKDMAPATQQDLMFGGVLYENGRDASGITESYQGKVDSSAQSGKAKEFAAAQSAGRKMSKYVMKKSWASDAYEMMFKVLLAFCDEKQRFTATIPDGSVEEQEFSKYLFLMRDEMTGEYWWYDDVAFSVDGMGTLGGDAQTRWERITNNFMQGTLGDPTSPRTLRLYWNMMDLAGYDDARIALAAIKESEQHLPWGVEQALLSNPDILEMTLRMVEEMGSGAVGSGSGGGKGGKPSVGANGQSTANVSHAAEVENNNERARMRNGR